MTITGLQADFDILRLASRVDPHPSLEIRLDRLKRLRAMVAAASSIFVETISADFGGRARPETEMLEIVPLMNGLRHTRAHLARWMRDERRHVALTFQPARCWIRYEPLGVVGIISPWNYPLLLALAPLTDVLAAGNRAMIKPSELTPRFSQLLATCIRDHFAPEEVAVVTGGVDVARAFTSLPFDHLMFTGSTAVGRDVMRAAAENLTPVTLELGGKSPAIIAPDYPLKQAAQSIAFGKFLNAGQTCIAPDYVLVPEGQADAFAEHVIQAAEHSYPTIENNSDYSNIISDRHRQRLLGAIDEARAAGAKIISHPDATGRNGKVGPTVIIDPPADGLLMREEIFGPVLPVVAYTDLGHAMAIIGRFERPLALYSFASNRRFHDKVLNRITSGGVTLNGTLLHIAQDDLPFGGIGASGMGAYHGEHGFRRFSHARAVHQIGAMNVFEKLGPPWGKLAGIVTRVLGR